MRDNLEFKPVFTDVARSYNIVVYFVYKYIKRTIMISLKITKQRVVEMNERAFIPLVSERRLTETSIKLRTGKYSLNFLISTRFFPEQA